MWWLSKRGEEEKGKSLVGTPRCVSQRKCEKLREVEVRKSSEVTLKGRRKRREKEREESCLSAQLNILKEVWKVKRSGSEDEEQCVMIKGKKEEERKTKGKGLSVHAAESRKGSVGG